MSSFRSFILFTFYGFPSLQPYILNPAWGSPLLVIEWTPCVLSSSSLPSLAGFLGTCLLNILPYSTFKNYLMVLVCLFDLWSLPLLTSDIWVRKYFLQELWKKKSMTKLNVCWSFLSYDDFNLRLKCKSLLFSLETKASVKEINLLEEKITSQFLWNANLHMCFIMMNYVIFEELLEF